MHILKWEDFLKKQIFTEYLIDPFDKKYKLIPELIPSTSWFENARKHFEKDWPRLKKECYIKAGYKCEICNGKGPTHPVEAHEVWLYNHEEKVQKMERLLALCPACHRVKHSGLWVFVKNRPDLVIPHMVKVNNITIEEAVVLLEAHMAIYHYRSQIKWKVDMSFLKKHNIEASNYIFNK